MDLNIFFIIGGAAFLLCLLAALDLTRIIRKKAHDWREIDQEAEEETSPLMETGNEDIEEYDAQAPAPSTSPDEITRLDLPRKPEIFDHILTHTDWDGIISGALLKHFSPLAKVEVTTPRGIRVALRHLAKNPDKPHRLFITDVGIGSEYLADIEDALIDLNKAGVKIYWYDHHPWSPLSVETAARDCTDIIVDPRFRNAADIVHQRITGDEPYADKLMRLINNKLQPEEADWGKNWRMLILSVQSAPSYGDIIDLITNLAADRAFSVADKFKIKRMEEENKVYEKFAKGKHRKESTQSGMEFLIVDLRVFRMEYDENGQLKRKFARHNPPASIGYDIVKYHNPDFYIMVLKNERLSIRGGRERKFKVDNLRDLRSIKGNPVRVSGHSYAAGVYLTVGMLSKLKYIVNWNFPQEVEDFIDEVKARI